MTRRRLLAAAAAPLAARLWAQRKAEPPQNILLIVADNLAAWMLGIYGNKEIRTPNIDLLARTGVRFLYSFACAPEISLSRFTLLTGRTPMQHAPSSSLAAEVMLSDVLASRGYRCGYTGAWDIGDAAHPQHHFDYWRPMDPPKTGFADGAITRNAVEFLAQQKAGQPFFLAVSYFASGGHPPAYDDLYAKTPFDTISPDRQPAANAQAGKEMFKDLVGSIRKRAAAVTAMDGQIPALLESLEQRGVHDDTLIVFTAADGFLLGRHGLWGAGLASSPINMYDESILVPMIWSWSGHTPPGVVRPDLVSLYDVVPSLCEVAGAPEPARNLCGRSFVPLATGRSLPKKHPWPATVFAQLRDTGMARDNRFKLVLRNQGKGPNELYALRNDPHERVNQYDNPEFLTVRDRLTAELAAWRNKYSS